MVRTRLLLTLGLTTGAILLSASAAGAETSAPPAVPKAVGFVGAVDAPDPQHDGINARPAIMAAGLLLVAGGAATAKRSWVSPVDAV